MDLDTFFTTLYCFVDDWYKREMADRMKRHAGPPLADERQRSIDRCDSWSVEGGRALAIRARHSALHAAKWSIMVSNDAEAQSV